MALRASLLASIGTTAIFLTDSPGWSAAVSTVSTLHGGKPDAPAAHRRRVIGDHVPAEVFGAAVSTPSTLCASISEARRPSSPCPGEPTASDERGNDSAVEEAPTPARGSLWLSKRACSTSGGAGNSLETKRRVQLCELRGGSTVAQGDDEPTEGMEEAHSMRVLVATTRISSYVDARGEIAAQSDWTVGRLKEELEQKFPGKIPASVQRLFKGTQLLSSSMTLEEASEGAEGPLSLLLDNAPPIDASRFDPDTAVPSRGEGQLEAFSACLSVQSALQSALLAAMRGDDGQKDEDMSCSVKMKADFENTQALLQRTLEEVPDSSADEQQEVYGILHEALRPLAHRLDVNWMQSIQYAFFAYICAQFGAQGALRQGLTLMVIPLIFLSQTRTARVGLKLARNLVIEVPLLTQVFMGLLQAPGQAILSLDRVAYTRNLYGPGGPKFDPAFLEGDGEDDRNANMMDVSGDGLYEEAFAVSTEDEE